MTKEQIQLARRAVACKGWRLMRGMTLVLSDGGTTLITRETNPNGWVSATRGFFSPESWAALDALPDLTDPATLGCLLALVREAWGMPTGITVTYSSDEGLWGVSWSGATHGGWCGRGKTEAEALVAALGAAPNNTKENT